MIEYDLLACARVMGRDKRYKKFANLVHRYFASLSSELDLSQAFDQLELASNLKDPEPVTETVHQAPEEAMLLGALFTSALLLYTRATQTSSKHRQSLPIRESYSDDQKVAHKEMMDLRNDAVAHYGPGDNLKDGLVADEQLNLRIQGTQIDFYHRYSRTNYRQNQFFDLITLVEAASGIIGVVKQERGAELQREMNELAERFEDFLPSIRDHLVTLPVEDRVGNVTGTFKLPAKDR
jgi:hypothetical protein